MSLCAQLPLQQQPIYRPESALDGARGHMQPHACPPTTPPPPCPLCACRLQLVSQSSPTTRSLPCPCPCHCSIRTCSGPQLAAESEKLQAPYLGLVLVRVCAAGKRQHDNSSSRGGLWRRHCMGDMYSEPSAMLRQRASRDKRNRERKTKNKSNHNKTR
jgi:hypothetical protein